MFKYKINEGVVKSLNNLMFVFMLKPYQINFDRRNLIQIQFSRSFIRHSKVFFLDEEGLEDSKDFFFG